MILVKLYGSAQKLAGRNEVEIAAAKGSRLKDVLRQIAPDRIDIPSRLASAILINGRNCAFREGLETAVADGDLIEILPIVSGG